MKSTAPPGALPDDRAALRNIVRRDTGEGYREMLEHLARESGIETPTAEDLARLDRKRKGKKLSNRRATPRPRSCQDEGRHDASGLQARHAWTPARWWPRLHPADEGDTTTLLRAAAPTACVTDGHSRAVLKALWKTRIAEPKQKGFARWGGDEAARRAVTNNRTRLLSGVAKEAFKLRAEIVERSFAHNLDRGGMRRTWLRGRENVHKRYLLQPQPIVAMRQLIGAALWRYFPAHADLVALGVSQSGQTVFAAA